MKQIMHFHILISEGCEFLHLESVNFLDHMDRILQETFRASVLEDCLDMKGNLCYFLYVI